MGLFFLALVIVIILIVNRKTQQNYANFEESWEQLLKKMSIESLVTQSLSNTNETIGEWEDITPSTINNAIINNQIIIIKEKKYAIPPSCSISLHEDILKVFIISEEEDGSKSVRLFTYNYSSPERSTVVTTLFKTDSSNKKMFLANSDTNSTGKLFTYVQFFYDIKNGNKVSILYPQKDKWEIYGLEKKSKYIKGKYSFGWDLKINFDATLRDDSGEDQVRIVTSMILPVERSLIVIDASKSEGDTEKYFSNNGTYGIGNSVAITTDGNTVFAGATFPWQSGGGVHIWISDSVGNKQHTWEKLQVFAEDFRVRSLSIDKTGDRVVIAGRKGMGLNLNWEVSVFDKDEETGTWNKVFDISLDDGWIYPPVTVSITPDQGYIAVSTIDALYIFDNKGKKIGKKQLSKYILIRESALSVNTDSNNNYIIIPVVLVEPADSCPLPCSDPWRLGESKVEIWKFRKTN